MKNAITDALFSLFHSVFTLNILEIALFVICDTDHENLLKIYFESNIYNTEFHKRISS